MILVGQKDKPQAVERPPGDVHLRLVAVDVINGSLNGGDFLSFSRLFAYASTPLDFR